MVDTEQPAAVIVRHRSCGLAIALDSTRYASALILRPTQMSQNPVFWSVGLTGKYERLLKFA